MPEVDVNLSERAWSNLRAYAGRRGITTDEAAKEVFDKELDRRLRFSRRKGVVRPFPLLKKV